MPDWLAEQRDMIIAEATRRAELALSSRSIPATVTALSSSPVGEATQFMSGYSGGVTVFPFMLDYSLLDGDDLLAG